MKLLLEKGADVREKRPDDSTAFLDAVGSDRVELARLLWEAGANPNGRRLGGRGANLDPLQHATLWGEFDMLRLLLDRGSDIIRAQGWPLWVAVEAGNIHMVTFLLDRGAPVDGSDKGEGMFTSLMCAAQGGHAEIARLLLQRGANINARDNRGLTALQIAKRWGNKETVAMLKEYGATQ